MRTFDRFNGLSSNILLTFRCYFDNPQMPWGGAFEQKLLAQFKCRAYVRPPPPPSHSSLTLIGGRLIGCYHLARKSGNFGLKSNGKIIFRKFRSEIVEYLQRYSSFSVRNGTAEISLPFAKLSSFQTLISRKQLREIEV